MDHPEAWDSGSILAQIHYKRGFLTKAEQLFSKVLESRKTLLGANNSYTLVTQMNLANTFRRQGRLDDAKELAAETLSQYQQGFGSRHLGTFTVMSGLAWTLRAMGQVSEAIALMQQCYEGRRSMLGPDHTYTRTDAATLNQWLDEDKRSKIGRSVGI